MYVMVGTAHQVTAVTVDMQVALMLLLSIPALPFAAVQQALPPSDLQVVTQVALVLLLFGTIVGDFALIADVSTRAVSKLSQPGQAPFWLVAGGGRGAMMVVALAIVFPLCLLRGMRQVGRCASQMGAGEAYTSEPPIHCLRRCHVASVDNKMVALSLPVVAASCPCFGTNRWMYAGPARTSSLTQHRSDACRCLLAAHGHSQLCCHWTLPPLLRLTDAHTCCT